MKRIDIARVVPVLVLALAVLEGCAGSPADAAEVARNMATVRAYVDASNRGDTEYLDEYLAPDYAYHGAAGELDADGFRAFHEMVLSAFPGLAFRIDDMIAAGDRVVTRWTMEGVHEGEFQGIAPTGNHVTVQGIIISRFENGRVAEEWEEADLMGLLRQLGVSAPPADPER
jgi:steroid delta-isomerase-like uncharacterized protein